MHKLWQHSNGTWYVRFGHRERQRISTRSSNRDEAEIFLSQFIAGSQEPTIADQTVAKILVAYRDDHGKGLRGQDGLKYGVDALIRGVGNLTPECLTPTAIKRYALQRGASDGTVLREVGVLRAALGYAVLHKLIPSRPEINNPVPTPLPRQRWMSKDEARRLLAACTVPHIRLFILLALNTCARSGAILEATWKQIDWDRRLIDMGRGHGNKRRAVVPLNDDAYPALLIAKELACSDHIIEYFGRPVASITKGFNAARAKAKLEDVTPHILRHTAASWMVEAGVPIAEVARMLGDSEKTVERVYGKHGPDYLKRASAATMLG
jgi:integrase